MQYAEQRHAVVETARRMLTGRLTERTSGNVSCRLPPDPAGDARYAITPHGVDYMEMDAADIVLLDADGEVLAAGATGALPSVEKSVHLQIFTVRPDIGAVIHSHPTHAQMLAVARVPLPSIIDEAWVELGPLVPVAEYAISGTEDLARNVVAALGDDRACLMASHGLVVAGRDLDHALSLSELVEHLCEVYIGARALGGPADLPEDAENLYRKVYEYQRQQENDGIKP